MLPRTLFVARGKGAVGWYRCALPAMVLGCDWVGAIGDPGELRLVTGMAPDDLDLDGFSRYDVLVLSQVAGPAWLRAIRGWQARGITVLYEIDDWLHGVRKLERHAHKDHFSRDEVASYELCMRAADGIICSTEWLARRYRSLNPRTWVCRNGIDARRFALTRPPRAEVGVGWAGGTGHTASAKPWVREVGAVMRRRPDVRFISVGQPFAQWLEAEFGAERCLAIPFTALEVYPSAMAHFDVALAPAGRGGYFQGKSDLRWLEASTLGIPTIADPTVYPEIEHGATGFHAKTPQEMAAILDELVGDRALRELVGAAAREHVLEHRTAQVAAQQWAEVLREAGHATLAA
ncbi:MAG TPA: glycosyltransferase [Solirubrobacteraceae bacterium]|jgi:glycosyltransferase involved in cell wall biosynthesis|nr:glycosyltransferase [Solirubrobacteraceae bacterium]